MGALVTYKCDGEGCESIKKEANHWWNVWIQRVGTPVLQVRPMRDGQAGDDELTMCSESCVSKALSRWMQGNK
jgi:hypothetical protein